MRTVVLIPARFASSRFPGKPLVPLLGKSMIRWVAELGAEAVGRENVYVATDDERIKQEVEGAGFEVVVTSSHALTGTDRLAEAAAQIDADIFINVQGDEPLVMPTDIVKIAQAKAANMGEVVNGYCPINENEDPASRNIPKVIFREDGRMIYMSRSLIPGYKDETNRPSRYFKQVCIYAFTRDELVSFSDYGRKSSLEKAEDIEILRFLELGKSIQMIETSPGSLAVDVPADVAPVEAAMKELRGL